MASTKKLLLGLLLTGVGLAVATAGCDTQPGPTKTSAPKVSNATNPPGYRPLSASQRELVELALASASAIPVDPHIKDRSRAQEEVVGVCLQLGQPQMAQAGVARIQDWRQGTAYGDLALYCLENGPRESVPTYIQRAENTANAAFLDDWRRAQIMAKVARAKMLLEQRDPSRKTHAGATSSPVPAVMLDVGGDNFGDQVQALDAMLAGKTLDDTQRATETYSQLYDRHYADAARRRLAETKIKEGWGPLPISIRFHLLEELARISLDHGDAGSALTQIDEAQGLLEKTAWQTDDRIAFMAELAVLRFRAGQQARAREYFQSAVTVYDTQSSSILKTDRATTLRNLAGACQTMKNNTEALGIYRRAVEEGADNPNARPRALDLSATCTSMALHGVEPDASLIARLHQILRGLDNPW